MQNNYTYAVILDYSEEGFINMLFPEFENLISCVETDEDPVENAQECLALAIMDLEARGEPMPVRKQETDIVIAKDQKLVYVNVWLPYYRSKVKETYVKKTLTIPVWLDILARQNNINFSETLVNALKAKMNLC